MIMREDVVQMEMKDFSQTARQPNLPHIRKNKKIQ